MRAFLVLPPLPCTMMRRCDYHTHTPLCLHAEGEPEDFVQIALQRGLCDYGISDHAPMPHASEPFDDWRMLEAQLPDYMQWIERAKVAAAGSELRILQSLECDYLPNCDAWIKQLRQRYRWDYLIGSIHYITEAEAFDAPLYADRSATSSVERDWQIYWQRATDLVRSGLFDIVGHCDIIKIWGRYPGGDYSPYYQDFLLALREQPMAVELNVAGWLKHCAEQYPARALLQALLAQGTPICINSDSHAPTQLNRMWDKGLTLLQELCGGQLQQGTYTSQTGTKLYVFSR